MSLLLVYQIWPALYKYTSCRLIYYTTRIPMLSHLYHHPITPVFATFQDVLSNRFYCVDETVQTTCQSREALKSKSGEQAKAISSKVIPSKSQKLNCDFYFPGSGSCSDSIAVWYLGRTRNNRMIGVNCIGNHMDNWGYCFCRISALTLL